MQITVQKTFSEGINRHFHLHIPSACRFTAHISAQNLLRGYRQALPPPYTLVPQLHSLHSLLKDFPRGYRQTFPASYTLCLPLYNLNHCSKISSEGTSKCFRLHIPSFSHFTAYITRIISCTKELDQLGFVLLFNHIVHFLYIIFKYNNIA